MEERLARVETILCGNDLRCTDEESIENKLRIVKQKLFDIEQKIEGWTPFWTQCKKMMSRALLK